MRCTICGKAVAKRQKHRAHPDCVTIVQVERKLGKRSYVEKMADFQRIYSTTPEKIASMLLAPLTYSDSDEGIIKKVERDLANKTPGPAEFQRSHRRPR